jgi:hypothetical protein
MIETTLAAGDLLTAIPGLWDAARIPLAIIAIAVGGVSGAFSLTRGFGAAAGRCSAVWRSPQSSSAAPGWPPR